MTYVVQSSIQRPDRYSNKVDLARRCSELTATCCPSIGSDFFTNNEGCLELGSEDTVGAVILYAVLLPHRAAALR